MIPGKRISGWTRLGHMMVGLCLVVVAVLCFWQQGELAKLRMGGTVKNVSTLIVRRISDGEVLLKLVDDPEKGTGYNWSVHTHWRGENFTDGGEEVTAPALHWTLKVLQLKTDVTPPRCVKEYHFPLSAVSREFDYGEGYELTRRGQTPGSDETH